MQFFSSNFKLGILGGGQLGKMLLSESTRYDIFSKVLDPNPNAPCSTIANEFTVGDLTIGSTAAKKAGVETIWVPSNSMYPETTNGCALITQVELGNGPEMKVLDFDPSSDEHAQFSVAFPKSWNEGTITFKAYFTVTGTNFCPL